MSDMVRLVHHLASGAELLFSRMRAKVHGLVARAMCRGLRLRLAARSARRHLAMATRKPRAEFDRVASNDNRRKDWCCEHSVGLNPTADLPTTYLWSSEPVVADGIAGACRVRLWAAIFQSEPSLTSTRIQLPVTVSPGFKFGLLR